MVKSPDWEKLYEDYYEQELERAIEQEEDRSLSKIKQIFHNNILPSVAEKGGGGVHWAYSEDRFDNKLQDMFDRFEVGRKKEAIISKYEQLESLEVQEARALRMQAGELTLKQVIGKATAGIRKEPRFSLKDIQELE